MDIDHPIRRVLDRLESVEGGNGRYNARCPAHNDHRPSLTVEEVEEDGSSKVLLKCWAGCKKEAILEKLGLEWSALFSENGSEASRRRIVSTYDYTYPAGELLFQVVRFEPKDFRQRRPDVGGNWIWNLEGIEPVLCRLPEVMRAILAGEMVLFCEGEKDVDNTRERLGVTATTCPMGAGKWRDSYAATLRGADVVVVGDNDPAGRRHVLTVAKELKGVAKSVKVLKLPHLAEKQDLSDWLNAGGTREEFDFLVTKTPQYFLPTKDTEFYAAADDEWEAPVSLPEGLPPVASLDPAMVPEPLRGWIVDVSERMQIPSDFAAAGAVVVAGSLIGRKVGIRPKRYDDWLVVPNLWGAVVGRPSLMKSPALAEVLKPLGRLIAEAYEEYREAQRAYETDVMVAEATKGALKDELKKAAREAAKNEDRSKLEEIARRSQDAESPEEPVLKRYKTEDATVEKISEILLENPRGILVHRDELSGWLRNLDKQGREGDRAFYLESWNGTGSFDVDRIGRGSLHVPALCLSIVGSIQPGPLSTYVYQATQGEKGDDGLLQRFQLLVWPDPPSAWRNVDRWPDTEAKNRAYEVFKQLDALDPVDFGTSGEDEEGIPAVRFTEEAQEVFDRWRDELEGRLRSEELPPALESHLAKYRSLMPSLALAIQLIEYVDGTGEEGAVGLRPTLQAAAWCEYLETHATRLYSSAENPAMEGARALMERIHKGDVRNGDSTRSVYRRHWAKLSTPEEVNGACTVLEEFGWIRVEVIKTGGRSTSKLRLHPSLREQACS